MGEITKELLRYGPQGLINLILLYAVIHLYKANRQQDKEHREEMAKKDKEHRDEVDALVQRHMGKAETWIEKGHEHAQRLNTFLETVSKEIARRGR